jgi:hypothetical protein
MHPSLRKLIAVTLLCALPIAAAGCAGWQGSRDVNTDVGGDAEGKGPGLLTGKRGGIIFESEPWTGASPGGDTAE